MGPGWASVAGTHGFQFSTSWVTSACSSVKGSYALPASQVWGKFKRQNLRNTRRRAGSARMVMRFRACRARSFNHRQPLLSPGARGQEAPRTRREDRPSAPRAGPELGHGRRPSREGLSAE